MLLLSLLRVACAGIIRKVRIFRYVCEISHGCRLARPLHLKGQIFASGLARTCFHSW